MPRPPTPLLLGALLVAASLALLGLRANPANPANPPTAANAANAPRAQAAKLRQAEAAELATLLAQRKAATTPREALALQRRIERRKRQTELELLRAQAQAARSSDATALAEAIDARIQQAEQAWQLSADPSTAPATPTTPETR